MENISSQGAVLSPRLSFSVHTELETYTETCTLPPLKILLNIFHLPNRSAALDSLS